MPEESIENKYRKEIEVSEDDVTFVSAYLKLTRIGDEVLNVGSEFWDGSISAYEGLIKMKALLEIAGELNNEIKKNL